MESSDTQGSLQKSSTNLEEEIKETFVEIMDLIDQSKDSISETTAAHQLMEKLRHLQTIKTMVTQGLHLGWIWRSDTEEVFQLQQY